jgi:hypothetical protein
MYVSCVDAVQAVQQRRKGDAHNDDHGVGCVHCSAVACLPVACSTAAGAFTRLQVICMT